MDIETLAEERPEALAKVAVDPQVGIDAAKADEIVTAAGFADDLKGQIADVLQKLWAVYREEDATLVEVNPLVRTEDGAIIALDGKVSLDANADFRHPRPRRARGQGGGRPARGGGARRRASTTSSSTARSASSATAPGS